MYIAKSSIGMRKHHGKVMRVDPEPDSGTPGSLPFFSFLSKLPDDPAVISPPPSNQASIPFKWEEAPGKPKMFSTRFSGFRASLALKLPPRLYEKEETHLTRMSSSSSVLHRTYTDFSLPSLGSSGSECWSPINADQKQQPRTSSFSSWDAMGVCGGNKRSDREMEFLVQDGDGSNGDEVDTMIRIKKNRRRWKFVNLFQRKSRSWGRIYKSISKMMHWKNRQRRYMALPGGSCHLHQIHGLPSLI